MKIGTLRKLAEKYNLYIDLCHLFGFTVGYGKSVWLCDSKDLFTVNFIGLDDDEALKLKLTKDNVEDLQQFIKDTYSDIPAGTILAGIDINWDWTTKDVLNEIDSFYKNVESFLKELKKANR